MFEGKFQYLSQPYFLVVLLVAIFLGTRIASIFGDHKFSYNLFVVVGRFDRINLVRFSVTQVIRCAVCVELLLQFFCVRLFM